jgi:GT2 family glycosyltransferase
VSALPTVSIVFLVYNRREELRESLRRMTRESDYPAELVDVIVVDNASEDGASEMVRGEFGDVQLITREVNCGISGWNDGFAVATGEYVLVLDDDCYLPPHGLRGAVDAAREHEADLVSFGVVSSEDPTLRFDHQYRTGLLTFWGCAALIRRAALDEAGYYDPEIFVWAHEVEFMLRFYDAGFRHVHMPDLLAYHMKGRGVSWAESVGMAPYRMNHKNLAYTAGKHLRAKQAAGALVALLTTHLRDGLRGDSGAIRAIPSSTRGFLHGLRHRSPVRDPQVSVVYRQNFLSWASPWWWSRPPLLWLASLPGAVVRRALGRRRRAAHRGRRAEYFARAARYYPTTTATLQLRDRSSVQAGAPRSVQA